MVNRLVKEMGYRSLTLLSFSIATLMVSFPVQAAEFDVAQNLTNLNRPLEKQQALTSSIQNTHLVIKLRDRRVYVYQDNQLKTSYPIAIGKAGWETPTGSFSVIDMQKNPAWQHPWKGTVIPPGPDNPLGLRWIGFWTDGKNFIGFHGTPQENLVGQAVSHGCIRMRNQDILNLYAQVGIGTPVTVEP